MRVFTALLLNADKVASRINSDFSSLSGAQNRGSTSSPVHSVAFGPRPVSGSSNQSHKSPTFFGPEDVKSLEVSRPSCPFSMPATIYQTTASNSTFAEMDNRHIGLDVTATTTSSRHSAVNDFATSSFYPFSSCRNDASNATGGRDTCSLMKHEQTSSGVPYKTLSNLPRIGSVSPSLDCLDEPSLIESSIEASILGFFQ
ncbi:unnamed protein product [Protopolystoma xenopodis]|uniref:Uncharacterized protein n=1 Tax=Protopolystoma xenopodis TaxID=117903 RepID=A0A448X350_9PLAT|nr:unnamed protein product [Protopolystoma xenopodis]